MKINVLRFKTGHMLLIAFIVMMALLPIMGIGWYYFHVLLLYFIYLTYAEVWNLLAGYSGLISLGQPAFIGLGGYTLAMLLYFYDMPLFQNFIISLIVVTVFAAIISVPVFKLRGFYFAIGTWVLIEALRIWFTWWRPIPDPAAAVGGGAGFKIWTGISPMGLYYFALMIGFGTILLMRFILSSKLGLGLMAIRDNERAAESCGINVFRCKFYSFLIGAFVTGLAACCFWSLQRYIEPLGAFSISWTNLMLASVIIGGIGTEEGPIVGAGIAVFLEQALPGYAEFSPIILGILLIPVIVIAPRGLMGTLRKTQTYNLLLKSLGKDLR